MRTARARPAQEVEGDALEEPLRHDAFGAAGLHEQQTEPHLTAPGVDGDELEVGPVGLHQGAHLLEGGVERPGVDHGLTTGR
ncbi:MAG: hypothetical protein ACRDZ1_19135 [Acidimicrobiia bacterium]